jgi:hypothetical protein
MTVELQQNVIVTLYLLFSHNYIAIVYLAGLLISVGLSVWRPSRFATFLLLGFAILLFSFEYDKHIINAFREQTINSLITLQPHYRLQHLLNLIISEIFPVLFYIIGWAFIFVAIVYAALKMNQQGKSAKN